ncbi:hypothetical protein AB0M28_33670 [Streptomyces sp. NPDC051940]|uniref:hypothetical protein n=1 Tax=Streptomyces sp. NPDC051940 TaxID=3155675 RepID=UPI003435EC3D
MDATWVGTISALVGTMTGALLQAWREHALHRREMAVRWDQTLLTALADYLATADRALRGLLRWRNARDSGAAGLAEEAAAALQAYEALHEKSQLISLLTGARTDEVRDSARRMRRALLPMCDEVRGGQPLDRTRLAQLIQDHREARDTLIHRAQSRLTPPGP